MEKIKEENDQAREEAAQFVTIISKKLLIKLNDKIIDGIYEIVKALDTEESRFRVTLLKRNMKVTSH